MSINDVWNWVLYVHDSKFNLSRLQNCYVCCHRFQEMIMVLFWSCNIFYKKYHFQVPVHWGPLMTIIDHHSTLEVRSGFEPEYFVLIQVVPFFIDSFVQWKIEHKDHQVKHWFVFPWLVHATLFRPRDRF